MRRYWESESDRMVFECYWCGEIIILLGHKEDWYTEEGYIFFECQCGQRLTISAEPR
jgi:hypothetical protein